MQREVKGKTSSSEFASWLVEEDKLDGARVSEQVKSHSKGKPQDQGIRDMPSGLLPSSITTHTNRP